MIDYKKKYLDALERANSFQEKYGGDYAGYIFPELRESEDEKIRKFLIDYFTSYKIGNVATKLNGYRIDDILNYLEKQKEQKPDTRDCDDLQLLGFIYDLLNEIEWKDNWAMSKDECLRRLNNYRPQKPAEWSEEDEKMLEGTLNSLRRYQLSLPNFQVELQIRWLKSLRSRPKSSDNWKPSEEQIYSLGTVVKGAGENSVGSVAYNLKELYEQLKRLKEDEQ